MKKIRSYAVLISMTAALSFLGACSDNGDTDVAPPAPAMDSPAPAPATTPDPVTPDPSLE